MNSKAIQVKKVSIYFDSPREQGGFDILPKRTKYCLSKYFKKFDKSERDKVEYFVSDMWLTFFKYQFGLVQECNENCR